MINAAKADGQIDGNEMNNILSKLDEAGADQEAKDFVLAEMRRPLDLDSLVAGVRTPGLAAAVYAASTMAIQVDTPAEQNYLAQLASRLRHPARRSAPASTPAWASGAPSSANRARAGSSGPGRTAIDEPARGNSVPPAQARSNSALVALAPAASPAASWASIRP